MKRGLAGCLGLALALHGAVLAALVSRPAHSWQLGTPVPVASMEVRMLAPAPPAAAAVAPEPSQEEAPARRPEPRATLAQPDPAAATDAVAGTPLPPGIAQIRQPDLALGSASVEVHVWLELDGDGAVTALDVTENPPDALAPYVLAAQDGLQRAHFDTAGDAVLPAALAPRRLCVSVRFTDQQPVQLQSLGLTSPERCLQPPQPLNAATR